MRSIAFCVGIRTGFIIIPLQSYCNEMGLNEDDKNHLKTKFIIFSVFSHCVHPFRLHGNIRTITNKQVRIHKLPLRV